MTVAVEGVEVFIWPVRGAGKRGEDNANFRSNSRQIQLVIATALSEPRPLKGTPCQAAIRSI